MSASIDYLAIATITIFTSFFAGLGAEVAKVLIEYVKRFRKQLRKEKEI